MSEEFTDSNNPAQNEGVTIRSLRSDLAQKYARQLDAVKELQHTMNLAKSNMDREQRELEETALKLKELVGRNRPLVLTPLGDSRHLIVYSTNGGYGPYARIDIVEESR